MTEQQIESLKNLKRPDECYSLNYYGGLFSTCDFLDITYCYGKPGVFFCTVLDEYISSGCRTAKCADYKFTKKLVEVI